MAKWFYENEKVKGELTRSRKAKAAGFYPYFREFESGGVKTTVKGRPIINFSSNDYLGLTMDPRVREAAKQAVDRYGIGLGSSRLQATTVAHIEFEKKLAEWMDVEAVLVTTTGYQAVVSSISTLIERDCTILIDALSHASIIDGTFLANGFPKRNTDVRLFRHNDATHLRKLLETLKTPHAAIVAESVYSLDGDLGPMREIADLAEEFDAMTFIDDAHGTGTIGKTGRGCVEYFGLKDRFDVVISTFSKSLGSIGGFIMTTKDIVEYMHHNARPFVFSASLPVPVLAAASKIVDIIRTDPEPLAKLNRNKERMRTGLKERGFNLGQSESHIMPVMTYDEESTFIFSQTLFDAGFYLVPIVYPAVKKGVERMRCNITAGHSDEDIDRLLDTLVAIRKKLGISCQPKE